jgi:hypothetical protein
LPLAALGKTPLTNRAVSRIRHGKGRPFSPKFPR